MSDYKFPTEMVELPSQGHFYKEGHPLASGKVEVKYMTAKEEDILTSRNLIQDGTVIDKLLQSLIVDDSIDVGDLLVGDKNAVMLAARILGYGKDYQFEYDGVEQTVDLTKIEPVQIDFSQYVKGQNQFSYTLPNSKREITFKLLSGNDEAVIAEEVQARKKISENDSAELTTRLKHIILSVDTKSQKSYINNFVDNEFLSIDSLAFRKYLSSITPDVNMNTTVKDSAGKEIEVMIPITLRFFWPNTGI